MREIMDTKIKWTKNSRIGEVLDSKFGKEILTFIAQFSGKSMKDLDKFYIRTLPLKSYPIISRLSGIEFDSQLINWIVEKLNQKDLFSNPLPIPEKFEKRWWKDAVIYHLFVPSFRDANNDGIGDIRGIINRFEYLLTLNINAILLSPLFDSPFHDVAFDVRNFTEINEKFGDENDLKELIALCHHHKIKVILTFPMNQTSDEHAWFKDESNIPSYSSKDTTDYYISEEVPNNWQSHYGDSAWRYERVPKRYYLHLKSTKQIELNWHNDVLRKEMIQSMQYWKQFDIDGLLLESSSFIAKNKNYAEGNKIIGNITGITGIEQYTYQPELLLWLEEIYEALKKDDPNFLIISDNQKMNNYFLKYLSGDATKRSDLGLSYYQFLHQFDDNHHGPDKISLQHLNHTWLQMQIDSDNSFWPIIFCEDLNHSRIISRVSSDISYRSQIAKLIATMQLTAKGTILLYQGQELGQVNASFHNISQLRDIEALNKYEKIIESSASIDHSNSVEKILNSSKDHARIPIAWNDSINGGFSECSSTWIDCFSDPGMTLMDQTNDSHSILNYYRSLISLRLHFSTFIKGRFYSLDRNNKHIMRCLRIDKNHAFYIEMNLTDDHLNVVGLNRNQLRKVQEIENIPYDIPEKIDRTILLSNYPDRNQQEIKRNKDLRPYEAFIIKLY